MATAINFNLKPISFNPSVDGNSDTTYVMKVVNPTGTECDLTGYTARMQLRAYPESSTALDTLTTENSRLVISNGQVTIKFPASVTREYTFSHAVYDLLLVNGSAQWRIAQGTIDFNKGVTV